MIQRIGTYAETQETAQKLAVACRELRVLVYECQILKLLEDEQADVRGVVGTVCRETACTGASFVVLEVQWSILASVVAALYSVYNALRKPRSLSILLNRNEKQSNACCRFLNEMASIHTDLGKEICSRREHDIPIIKGMFGGHRVDRQELYHRSSLHDRVVYVEEAIRRLEHDIENIREMLMSCMASSEL